MHIISNCFRIVACLPAAGCNLYTDYISSQPKFHHSRATAEFSVRVPHGLFIRARYFPSHFWLLLSPLFPFHTYTLALKFIKQTIRKRCSQDLTKCSAPGLSYNRKTVSYSHFSFHRCAAGCSLSLIPCTAFNYIATRKLFTALHRMGAAYGLFANEKKIGRAASIEPINAAKNLCCCTLICLTVYYILINKKCLRVVGIPPLLPSMEPNSHLNVKTRIEARIEFCLDWAHQVQLAKMLVMMSLCYWQHIRCCTCDVGRNRTKNRHGTNENIESFARICYYKSSSTGCITRMDVCSTAKRLTLCEDDVMLKISLEFAGEASGKRWCERGRSEARHEIVSETIIII